MTAGGSGGGDAHGGYTSESGGEGGEPGGGGGESGGGGGESGDASSAAGVGGRPPDPPTAQFAVSTGNGHTCAVLDGSVQCWGDNDSGRLGINSTTDSLVPVPVPGLTGNVRVVDAGLYNTCALLVDGVECWGRRTGYLPGTSDALAPVQVSGFGNGISAIALGVYHLCALVEGGVQCAGSNSYGQLGNGSSGGSSLAPVAVTGLSGRISAIASGRDYTCAVSDQAARCWGANDVGQLGNGTTEKSSIPVQVLGLESGVSAIGASTASEVHTCAVANHSVRCWGDNGFGQLGNGEKTNSAQAVAVIELDGEVSALAVGGFHTCALVDGAVWCWGWNQDGQLGNGSTTDSSVPVKVEGLPGNVEAIDADGRHTCAIADDRLFCWGDNQYGQLGVGSMANSSIPVEVLAD